MLSGFYFFPPEKVDIDLFIYLLFIYRSTIPCLWFWYFKSYGTFYSSVTWTDAGTFCDPFFLTLLSVTTHAFAMETAIYVTAECCTRIHGRLHSRCYMHHINFLKCKELLNSETSSMTPRVLIKELRPTKFPLNCLRYDLKKIITAIIL